MRDSITAFQCQERCNEGGNANLPPVQPVPPEPHP